VQTHTERGGSVLDDTVTRVIRSSTDASPAELVAAWLAADLRATVTVLGTAAVQVRGNRAELGGPLRALLEETRFHGWHVERARRESASTPTPDLNVRRA
jgi:hypothetical protein